MNGVYQNIYANVTFLMTALDPMGMVQFPDGSFHAGYQYHPQHIQWGNISQGAAFSKDLVYWEDANSWQNPKTIVSFPVLTQSMVSSNTQLSGRVRCTIFVVCLTLRQEDQ